MAPSKGRKKNGKFASSSRAAKINGAKGGRKRKKG